MKSLPSKDDDSDNQSKNSATFFTPQGSVEEADAKEVNQPEEASSVDKCDHIFVEKVSPFNFLMQNDYFLGGNPITTSSHETVE